MNYDRQTSDRSERQNKKHLIFVNRFYYPDLSATSQILTDVTENLSANGFSIAVITSRNNYEGGTRYSKKEVVNNVVVRRVWTTQFGRGSIIGRAVDYLTFYVSASFSLLVSLKRGDLVISKTDPPMLSIWLGLVTRIKGAKLINWLQDLFPEVADRLSFFSSKGVLIGALKSIRNRSLKRAAVNVVIGERMAHELLLLGVGRKNINVIQNFADDAAILRSPQYSDDLRRDWGFSSRDFIVGYSGNLGRAHDYITILDVAAKLQAEPNIKFLFVGGGYLRAALSREISRRSLSNVFVKPYQPRSRLNESLALPNLHWLSLNPKLEGYVLPSKLYGIVAAGRPVLMIGAPNGEIGTLIDRWKFGHCVQPGAVEDAQKFIQKLHSTPELAEAFGKRARHFVDENASKRHAFKAWHELVERFNAE